MHQSVTKGTAYGSHSFIQGVGEICPWCISVWPTFFSHQLLKSGVYNVKRKKQSTVPCKALCCILPHQTHCHKVCWWGSQWTIQPGSSPHQLLPVFPSAVMAVLCWKHWSSENNMTLMERPMEQDDYTDVRQFANWKGPSSLPTSFLRWWRTILSVLSIRCDVKATSLKWLGSLGCAFLRTGITQLVCHKGWYSLQTEAQDEDMPNDPAELICTVPK